MSPIAVWSTAWQSSSAADMSHGVCEQSATSCDVDSNEIAIARASSSGHLLLNFRLRTPFWIPSHRCTRICWPWPPYWARSPAEDSCRSTISQQRSFANLNLKYKTKIDCVAVHAFACKPSTHVPFLYCSAKSCTKQYKYTIFVQSLSKLSISLPTVSVDPISYWKYNARRRPCSRWWVLCNGVPKNTSSMIQNRFECATFTWDRIETDSKRFNKAIQMFLSMINPANWLCCE